MNIRNQNGAAALAGAAQQAVGADAMRSKGNKKKHLIVLKLLNILKIED